MGTLAWNGNRHLEIYYAMPRSGMMCHTINPRLFPDQIAYIINYAGDRVQHLANGEENQASSFANAARPAD